MMNDGQRQEVLAALRVRIEKAEWAATGSDEAAVLPFCVSEIDGALPGDGLALGAIHEVCGGKIDEIHSAAAAAFCAGILARTRGAIVWTFARRDLFPPALADVGLIPDRVVQVDAGDAKTVLLVVEEALRHPGLGGVVGEIEGKIGLTASRRLQLAAETTGNLGLLLRRACPGQKLVTEPTAARTRWQVTALPTGPALAWSPSTPGLARGRWKLDLIRSRGGAPGSFIVEACDAQGRLGLAADVVDGSTAESISPGRAVA